MVAAAAVETAIRFAPADPELPTPWKALVDGSTGYIYYWNPESNVTQYEKPIPARPPPRVAPLPSVINVQSHHQSQHQQPAQHQQAQPQAQAQPHWDSRNGGNGTSNRFSALQPQQQQQQQATVTVNSTVVERREVVREAAPASMSVEAYRKQHEVTAMGDNVPPPFMAFDQTGFPPELLRELQDAGFRAPTPIQAQSWPVALQSRDIVAIAKTGSGKTLGYLLPAFILLKRRRNDNRMGPTVLVLAPTRELATQIQAEAIKFGRSSRISCTCLYGGAQKGPQIKELERGVDIVVATPGRLNDILEMGKIEMSQISYLILDEADRMLDMGFEPQIRKIVNELPRTRQTLMYTATWPNAVKRIAADLLVNPVQVTIGILDELATNKAITQHIELVPSFEKERRVEAILRGQQPGSKIIIFCSTKRMCDQLARSLGRQYGAMAIHGDKSQIERDSVLNQFRSGRSPILVATDVAARGLDIKDIKVVINYDFPNGIEDYVHRIGRTGRAGATGVAHTFITDQDSKHSTELIKILERAEQKIPQELRDLASRPGYFMKGRGGRGDYGGGRGRGGSSWGSSGGGRFDRSERGNGGSFGRNAAPYDSKNDYAETWNTDYSYNGKRSRSRSPDKYPYKRTSPRRSGWD